MNLKQALDHGLSQKNAHRMIKLNQKALPKPYTGMNIRLREKAKSTFEKDFLSL